MRQPFLYVYSWIVSLSSLYCLHCMCMQYGLNVVWMGKKSFFILHKAFKNLKQGFKQTLQLQENTFSFKFPLTLPLTPQLEATCSIVKKFCNVLKPHSESFTQ